MEPTQESVTDPILNVLTNVITSFEGGSIGMTFLVGGNWITGVVISPRAWFEDLAMFIDLSSSDKNLGEAMRLVGKEAYPSSSEIDAPESIGGVDPTTRRFIHLRDSKMFSTSGDLPIPNEGGLLRLRMNSIDGWILGNLGRRENMPPPLK